jgi:hypothetical protein
MTIEEKLEYLIEKIRVMNNAVNNETPDFALLEIERVCQMLDGWNDATTE